MNRPLTGPSNRAGAMGLGALYDHDHVQLSDWCLSRSPQVANAQGRSWPRSKDRDSGDSISMLMLQGELGTVGQGNVCLGRL